MVIWALMPSSVPSSLDRHLDVDLLLAGVARGEEVLVAVLDPLHRPPELAGCGGQAEVLPADAALEPEGAADVAGEHPHALHRAGRGVLASGMRSPWGDWVAA